MKNISLLTSLAALTVALLPSLPCRAMTETSKHWQEFKEAKDRSNESILTDYSYAGYEQGEQAIPQVNGPVFKVTDYGAIPDDALSDEEAIRKTVAAAEQAGGGVVLFPPGRFLVWADRSKVEAIRIHSPGVVIRGAGSGKGGTLIRAIHSGYGTGPYPVPKSGPDFEAIPYIFIFENPNKKDPNAHSTPVKGEVKRSTFQVEVASSDGYKPRGWVILKTQTTKLNPELMAGLEPDPSWKRIFDGISVAEAHQIREVRGNTLVLREPILVTLGADYEVKAWPTSMIERVGVEDIAFQGGWRESFVHHRSALDDEGWDGVLFNGVAHGWVRRCSFLNMNTGVYLKNSSHCSLLENRIAGTPGHYDLATRSDSSFNLMGLTDDQAGQRHGASTGNRSSGTTVWRWQIKPEQSIDSHGNGPYATLIDRVDGGTMTMSGGPAPSFPNHLRWMTFWNFRYGGSDAMPINLWDYKKGIAKFVKPLFVGIHGKPVTFVESALGGNESPGNAVLPESLYEAQLELRLGKLPEWIPSAKQEWQGVMSHELPFFGNPAYPGIDLFVESFDVNDLIKDVRDLMAKQELGWGVPVEFKTDGAPVVIRQDYPLLRTVLQQMCTYASALPMKGKDGEVPPPAKALNCEVIVSQKDISFRIPVNSTQKDQKENASALEVAKALTPALQGSLHTSASTLELTIPR